MILVTSTVSLALMYVLGYDQFKPPLLIAKSQVFIHIVEGPTATALSSSHSSLIVSILSAGTFFGALIAGDLAEIIGRRLTIIIGCIIYMVGVVLQVASHSLGLLVAGRLVAGLGVGFESAIVILYMSEIVSSSIVSKVVFMTNNFLQCPRKVRGALVSGYQVSSEGVYD